MAKVLKLTRVNDMMQVIYDDGTRQLAYPTGSGMWLPGSAGTTPPPDPGAAAFKWPFSRSLHTSYPSHSGMDWPGGSVGSSADIKVIGAGTVVSKSSINYNTYPGNRSEPYWRGNSLVINHGNINGVNIWSLYAHMRDVSSLAIGDAVTAGQVIGRVGNTGYSDGAHLHFEVIYNGVRLETGQGGYERTRDWMDANALGVW